MNRRPRLAVLLAGLFVLVGLPAARAQVVWSGATDWSYETATNWVGGVAPIATASVEFGDATRYTVQLPDSTTIANITFASSRTAAYTISDSSDYALLDLTGNITMSAGSNVDFSDTVDLELSSGTHVFSVTGSTLTIARNIYGSSSITKAGSGTLALGGDNPFSGGLTVSAGTLLVASSSGSYTPYDSSPVYTGPVGTGTLILGDGTTLGVAPSAGSITLANDIELVGTADPTIDTTNGDLSLFGDISGSNELSKIGTGTLTLFGANTYAGRTTITAGTLAISSDDNLGTAPGSPTPGHLVLDGGTLGALDTFTLNPHRGVSLGASGGTVSTESGVTLTYGGIIAGGGELTKSGTGTLRLTGVNTYSGGTVLADGELYINSTAALGTGGLIAAPVNSAVTLAIGTVPTISTPIEIQYGQLNLELDGPTVFSGVISGAGRLNHEDGFTLQLSGNNTYSGGTEISDAFGRIIASQDSALGTGPLELAAGAGVTFTTSAPHVGGLSGGHIYDGSSESIIALASGSTLTVNQAGDSVFAGKIGTNGASVAASLIKAGAGKLTLTGASESTSSASNYTGTTTINAGTLQFARQTALYNNITASWTANNLVVASGATVAFNVGGNDEFTSSDIATLASLGTPTGGGFRSGSKLGLDTSNADGNFTYSGVIANPNGGANALGLTKLGTHSLILNGANTYTGGTYINGGTLVAGNDTALSTGPVVFTGSSTQLHFNTATPVIGSLESSMSNVLLQLTQTSSILTINQPDLRSFRGEIRAGGSGDAARVIKTGAGTLQLTGGGLFYHSGVTGTDLLGDPQVSLQVNQGTVVVSNSFTIEDANPTIWVHGGTLALNNKTVNNPLVVDNGGRLAGNGSFKTATIGAGAILSPGFAGSDAIGTLAFTQHLTLASGGTLAWNISNPDGDASHDIVSVGSVSTLEITAISADRFTLKVISLDQSGNPGVMNGLVPGQLYTWTLFSTLGSGFVGFNADAFNIDPTLFSTNLGTGFAAGIFSVSLASENTRLKLNFTAVPEPSTYALMALGLGFIGLTVWRRRRS